MVTTLVHHLVESVEDVPEGFAWKPGHFDEFQLPSCIMSVSAGTGMQLCMMNLVSLLFTCLGFLFPHCEALMKTVLVLYAFLGIYGVWICFCSPLQNNGSITIEEQCTNARFSVS